jgi:plasmid stabilization system protein ParE
VAELVWEVEAISDLDLIGDYIARQSPDYAPVYVQRVVDAVGRLEAFPLSGRVVPELSDGAIREIVFQNYRIVYEVNSDNVIILGVIHAALDFSGVARERGWYLT